VFVRFYQGGENFVAESEPAALNPEELVKQVPAGVLAVGEGYRAYEEVFATIKDRIRLAGFEFDEPRASVIGRLGLERLRRGESDDIDSLVPVYVRGSDAETSKVEAK